MRARSLFPRARSAALGAADVLALSAARLAALGEVDAAARAYVRADTLARSIRAASTAAANAADARARHAFRRN